MHIYLLFVCTHKCVCVYYAAAAKSLQSCPTLCDPIDSSPQGSPVPGILQARTLEWVAISFSNAWKWKVKVKLLSRVRPSATPSTAAFQAPLSMGFSRHKYWSGVPLPSPRNSTFKVYTQKTHTFAELGYLPPRPSFQRLSAAQKHPVTQQKSFQLPAPSLYASDAECASAKPCPFKVAHPIS